AVGHLAVPSSQRYELYLNGAFGGRGLEVRVDGRKLGTVKHQLSGFISSIPVAAIYLPGGVHKFEYTYPNADPTPGNGETLGTGGGQPRVGESGPYLIVGSGPAGAAAAMALTAAGRQVVVLDAGLTLEPERDAARRRMAATAPALWSAADIALTRFSAGAAAGAGYKQLFGSDVAFRDDGALDLRQQPGVGARPSYARGGCHFGASRLAVRVGYPAPARGCCYSGHCLDGCPYGHIYNAGDTIAALSRDGLIDYRPGLHVQRLSERRGKVTVEARTLGGGAPVRIDAARAFLAAGAGSSTLVLPR